LGIGDGTFGSLQALSNVMVGPLSVADMNGDGLPDLVGKFQDSPRLAFATAPAVYASVTDLGGSSFISALAVGRWDEDAIPDLLMFNGAYRVFRGLGGGAFAPAQTLPEVSNLITFRAWTDMNGDGLSDIVASGMQGTFVCPGQSSGTFAPAIGAGVGGFVSGVAVGDVDGNGRPDMVAATTTVGGGQDLRRATVLLNQLSTPNVGVEPRPGMDVRLAVRVIPNPAMGDIRLSLRGNESWPARIELLDVAGRVVKHEHLPAGSSELVIGGAGTLVAGLYFARVRRGGAVLTTRVCVTR
jgi:hypothetical protein